MRATEARPGAGRHAGGRAPRAAARPGLRAPGRGGSSPRVEPLLRPDDLAPGDRDGGRRATGRDLAVRSVRGRRAIPTSRRPTSGSGREFGARGEMERRAVIGERLAWDPRAAGRRRGARLRAARAAPRRRRSRRCATTPRSCALDARGPARSRGPSSCTSRTCSSSRAHRGSGLAAWLRALPLQAARRCAAAAGCAPDTPIVLVAEMEPPDADEARRACARLRSYERAGFRKLDPAAAPYAQPDFRPAEILAGRRAAAGAARARAAPRRARGRGRRCRRPRSRAVVEAIYAVYGVHVPAAALGSAAGRGGRVDGSPAELPACYLPRA